MKFCSLATMSAQNETEVESLLMGPCWSQAHAGPNDQYLLDGHKLLLDHDLDSLPSSDTEGQKSTIEVLDNLLMNNHQSMQTNLAELKPLPPFTGYTGHLSINGISGHHYHAISQRLPEDNNNNSMGNNLNHSACLSHSPFSQNTGHGPNFNQNNNNHGNMCSVGVGNEGHNNLQPPLTPNSNCSSSTNSPTDHNIVSSSTCLPDSVLHPDEPCIHDVKLFSPESENKLYNVADSCVMANGNHTQSNNHNSGNRNMSSSDPRSADSVSGGLKIYTNESKELSEYDMSSIEDIAAIIGSAIADTTVPNRMDGDADTNHNNDSRDSWMDLDAWIDGACVQADGKLIITQQDNLGDYVMPQSPHSINGGCPSSGPILPNPGSTLQNLLTHGYMPLLQNRLQNGPPNCKGETPSSTSYGGSDLISTSTSPPGSVVSTTDNIIMGNGMNASRFMPNNNQHHYQLSMNIKADGLCSPDLLNNNNNNSSTNNNNYPHTTTILGNSPSNQQSSKMKRSRGPKHKLPGNSQVSPVGMGNGNNHLTSSGPMSPTTASMGLGFQGGSDLSGLLGKEKPVHRCNICNRGFLNKSNIKVHLRTHTGEKPFRCDVCSKAFRQKAHLIKHQQIHKRIGRD